MRMYVSSAQFHTALSVTQVVVKRAKLVLPVPIVITVLTVIRVTFAILALRAIITPQLKGNMLSASLILLPVMIVV